MRFRGNFPLMGDFLFSPEGFDQYDGSHRRYCAKGVEGRIIAGLRYAGLRLSANGALAFYVVMLTRGGQNQFRWIGDFFLGLCILEDAPAGTQVVLCGTFIHTSGCFAVYLFHGGIMIFGLKMHGVERNGFVDVAISVAIQRQILYARFLVFLNRFYNVSSDYLIGISNDPTTKA